MRYIIIFSAGLLISCTTTKPISELSYSEARYKADRASKRESDMYSLTKLLAMTKSVSSFKKSCDVSELANRKYVLSVVAQIDENGAVSKVWEKIPDSYSECFTQVLLKQSFPKPPMQPYFIAIDNVISGQPGG